MKLWNVTIVASEEITVEAETKEQAEELATEQSNFSSVDYCEVEEV